MNPLLGITEQVKAFWTSASPTARILLVTVSTLSIIAIVGVGVWSSRPNYIALASNLEPAEAAELVSTLAAAGIPSQMNFAGSSVQVPSTRWSEARLAAGEIVGGQTNSSNSSDSGGMSIFEGSSMSHHRLQQSKEFDLERSILKMRAVKSVDVHIAQPEWTPFARDQQPSTASVVLGLRNGTNLSKSQSLSIVQMVAGSIEGLSPNNVTLTDLDGNILSNVSNAETAIFDRLDYQRQIEAELVSKAESMLEKILGEGKAIVEVTAEIDFTERTRNAKTYDPSTKVKAEERIVTTERTGMKDDSGGAVGTSSNLAITDQASSDSKVASDSEEIDTKFLNAETTEQVKETAGTIKRLTVAAMVDLSGKPATDTEPESKSSLTEADVEAVVKAAVGFQTERNDQIQVLDAAIPLPTDDAVKAIATVNQWEFVSKIVRNSSLGLAAVVAVILIHLAFRKMKPVTVIVERDRKDEDKRMRAMSKLSEQIQTNPEAVSKVLAAWLRESNTNSSRSKAA